MKKIKILFALPFLAFLLLVVSRTNAQYYYYNQNGSNSSDQSLGKVSVGVNYNYSSPTGSFKNDLLNNGSPRGFQVNLLYDFTDHFSAGLEFGYQDFYQKYPRALYAQSATETWNAVLTNSIQSYPVLTKFVYSPLGDGYAVRPYATAGLGLDFVNFDQYLGEYGSSYDKACFSAKGGIGVYIPLLAENRLGLDFGADYNYVNYKKAGLDDNLNRWNYHGGIYFKLN